MLSLMKPAERFASLGTQMMGVEQQKHSNKTSNKMSNTKISLPSGFPPGWLPPAA
jgi:hypothetical protein